MNNYQFKELRVKKTKDHHDFKLLSEMIESAQKEGWLPFNPNYYWGERHLSQLMYKDFTCEFPKNEIIRLDFLRDEVCLFIDKPSRFGVETGQIPNFPKAVLFPDYRETMTSKFVVRPIESMFGIDEEVWISGIVYYNSGYWMWVEHEILREYETFPEDEPELAEYRHFMDCYKKHSQYVPLRIKNSMWNRVKRWWKNA